MMSSSTVSLIVELIVAGLLAVTIGYCVLLNKRLLRLRQDEQALKATIAELITATEIAERAIQGLKLTVRECDGTLGERLRTAERFVAEIEREVKSGKDVVNRVVRLIEASRKGGPVPDVDDADQAAIPSHASAANTLAAANAFAARVNTRAA
jgi:Domain of unknown function (DUF6468)